MTPPWPCVQRLDEVVTGHPYHTQLITQARRGESPAQRLQGPVSEQWVGGQRHLAAPLGSRSSDVTPPRSASRCRRKVILRPSLPRYVQGPGPGPGLGLAVQRGR